MPTLSLDFLMVLFNAHPLCLQVYCWGDNEHGQQGNNSTISSRKPQYLASLKDHRITKVACGSSHSMAFASGVPVTTIEFTPISFPTHNDPLGSALTSAARTAGGGGAVATAGTEDTHRVVILPEIKRPSLTRIILSLQTPLKQQEALAHVLTALQIAYARDAIVNSLGGVASAATQKQTTTGEEDKIGAESATSSLAGGGSEENTPTRKRGSLVPAVSGVDVEDFTSVLTVEDARVLVDLLKLAVANRVGERGKETLGAVLTAMGTANPEVPKSGSVLVC